MSLWQWVKPVLIQTAIISVIVFCLFVLVEVLVIRFGQIIERAFVKRRWVQYLVSSLAGSVPGCTGTFFIDAMYMAGIASFGAIVAAMVSTCGDEAFVLLSQLAVSNSINIKTLSMLFGSLFVLGIFAGWLADTVAKAINLRVCEKCLIEKHPEIDTTHIRLIPIGHFVKEHIWGHIIKKHMINIVFWIFISLLFVKFIGQFIYMEQIITHNKYMLLLVAAVVGILPVSGPNILFVTLFAQGILPFSIMLTNSIVQDGHGLLPILGFSVGDALKIKVFNLAFGLIVGFILMAFGI